MDRKISGRFSSLRLFQRPPLPTRDLAETFYAHAVSNSRADVINKCRATGSRCPIN